MFRLAAFDRIHGARINSSQLRRRTHADPTAARTAWRHEQQRQRQQDDRPQGSDDAPAAPVVRIEYGGCIGQRSNGDPAEVDAERRVYQPAFGGGYGRLADLQSVIADDQRQEQPDHHRH